jgi:hypothetical protein
MSVRLDIRTGSLIPPARSPWRSPVFRIGRQKDD